LILASRAVADSFNLHATMNPGAQASESAPCRQGLTCQRQRMTCQHLELTCQRKRLFAYGRALEAAGRGGAGHGRAPHPVTSASHYGQLVLQYGA